MFSLINRYVFRELAVPAVLGLVAYTSILLVQRFFVLADQWVAGVLTLQDVFLLLLYILPATVVTTIPMAVLLGILIGFSRLSSDSEITALRATGVSYYRLLVPTGLLAVIGWGASAAVYLEAVPWANTQYTVVQGRAGRRADINREIKPGAWVQVEGAAIFARSVEAGDVARPWLLDVDVVFSSAGAKRREHWRAERARVDKLVGDSTGRLRIEAEGLRTVAWESSPAAGPPILSRDERRTWIGEERPMTGGVKAAGASRSIRTDARSKTLRDLRWTLAQLEAMKRIDAETEVTDPRRAAEARDSLGTEWIPAPRRAVLERITKMEIHKKFSIPMACLVFALCGLPLGIATRRGSWQAAFVVSIGVIVLWYFIYQWGEAWMEAGELSPALGAWLPDIALATIGVYLLVRQRKQQRMGMYRVVRDVLMLGSVTSLLLTVLLAVDGWHLRGDWLVSMPRWPPTAAAVFVVLSLLVVLFRDPVARALAALTDRLKRHSARQMRVGEAEPSPDEDRALHAEEPAPVAHHPRMLKKLEDVRSGLVFALLAVLGVAAFQVFSNEGGLVAGARSLMTAWHGVLLVLMLLGFVALQLLGVRVMKTLDWWILTSYARVFALLLASFLLLYVIAEYLNLAESILQNDVRVARLVDLYANMLPEMLVQVMPMAAMVAALVCLGLVAKHNEATAVRCCGVSLFRLALPLVLVAAALSFATFLIHDYVMPRASVEAFQVREEIRGRPPVRRGAARGLVLADGGKTLYIHDRSISAIDGSDTQLFGLNVLRFDEGGSATELVVATVARWRGSEWVLENGWRASIGAGGAIARTTITREVVTDLEPPDYFTATAHEPDQMSFAEFRRYVEEQAEAGYPVDRLRVLLQRKLAFPLSCFVLVLVGLPFAFTAGRRGALYGVGLAVVLYIAYYAAVALFTALGSADYIPPTVAAWAPNALFALGGVFLFLHVRT